MKIRRIHLHARELDALLDGSKSQLRRALSPQPTLVPQPGWSWQFEPATGWRYANGSLSRFGIGHCPLGQPGDLLWVPEWFAVHPSLSDVAYRADSQGQPLLDSRGNPWAPAYLSPVLMPRARSRFTLRIINVRLERVQDINEPSAAAEGFGLNCKASFASTHVATARSSFCGFWDEVNGHGSWAANPWVWAVSFELIRANVDVVKTWRAAS